MNEWLIVNILSINCFLIFCSGKFQNVFGFLNYLQGVFFFNVFQCRVTQKELVGNLRLHFNIFTLLRSDFLTGCLWTILCPYMDPMRLVWFHNGEKIILLENVTGLWSWWRTWNPVKFVPQVHLWLRVNLAVVSRALSYHWQQSPITYPPSR